MHCWVVVECCLALEAGVFAEVALRYVTSILINFRKQLNLKLFYFKFQ